MSSQNQTQQGFIPKKTLTLDVWYRQGPAFIDERVCWVEYGKAKVDEEYDKAHMRDELSVQVPWQNDGRARE